MTADVVWFPRCPAAYLTSFTYLMLRWFLWLRQWGKTPIDVGASAEEVDPRYWVAMEIIQRETTRIEREELDRLKGEG